MRATLKVTLPADSDPPSGLVVTVRELTVAEVRAWVVESQASSYRDPLHALALLSLPGETVGLDELARLCDATPDDLEQFTPGEIQPLLEAAKALNPLFFQLRTLLAQTAATLSTPSTAASAPS